MSTRMLTCSKHTSMRAYTADLLQGLPGKYILMWFEYFYSNCDLKKNPTREPIEKNLNAKKWNF